MGGETEEQVSGWTTDTLRLAFIQQLQDLQAQINRRESAVERNIATAQELLQQQLTDLRIMLDERYATQVKAVDAAFIAQSTAMQTAFTAADRAVQAALESAEKAVTKAETAAEKRFEAVNEFRGQLADQAAGFIPRKEADVRLGALEDKIAAATENNAKLIGALTTRMDLGQGQSTGARDNSADARAVAAEARAGRAFILSVFLGFVSIAGILAAVLKK